MRKLKKQMIAVVLSAAMTMVLLTGGALAADETSNTFTDIAGSPYAEAIEALTEAGVMTGVGGGRFAPDMEVSRAMAVTVLGRMAQVEEETTDQFTDVDNESWYAGYVGWAAENGIVKGDGEGHFAPESAVTGEHMELMISRYARLKGIAYESTNTSTEALNRGEMADMVYKISRMSSSAVRETTHGKVQGFIEENGSYAWLGIPYAKAERWAAPTDPDAWTQTRTCTSAGSVAIQSSVNYATGESSIKGSEDCLNLDVYTPADAKGLPVLVFIHGGNNQTGQSTEIPGDELVITNNCVYISLNYRLGLFGFNCLPALQTAEDTTGNYALLDIAKALDWVKANAAAFGGDPENITVSGFSAGGRDVMAMLASPMFAGKFDKAIVLSGGMTMADVDKSAAQIAAAIAPLAVEDGKAEDADAAAAWLLTEGEDVLEYLKGLDASRLAPLMGNAGIRMSVFPHLYTDGVVLPTEGFATTTYNEVPVIMLTGSGEFSFFNGGGYLASKEFSALEEDVQAAAKEFSRKYGSDMYRIFNAQESANTMIANYDAPIYVCQIDFDDTVMGAFHGIFGPMLHSSMYAGMGDYTGTAYAGMSKSFNAYLTAFLATGDPNGEGRDEWKKWDAGTQLSMVFDGDENGAVVELKNVAKTYGDIIAEMEADTTVSKEIKTQLIHTVTNGRWFSDAQDAHFNVPSGWVADQK